MEMTGSLARYIAKSRGADSSWPLRSFEGESGTACKASNRAQLGLISIASGVANRNDQARFFHAQ